MIEDEVRKSTPKFQQRISQSIRCFCLRGSKEHVDSTIKKTISQNKNKKQHTWKPEECKQRAVVQPFVETNAK